MKRFIPALILGLFLCSGVQTAHAERMTILAIDPLPAQEGETPVVNVVDRVLRDDAPLAAIVLSRPPVILRDLDRGDEGRQRIQSALAVTTAPASLSGLDAALELFPTDREAEKDLILVTAGNSESSHELLQALDQLSRHGIRVRVHYLSSDADASEGTLGKVRQAVAEAIGLPEGGVEPETRFLEDLALDATSAWEIVAAVCASFGTLLPTEQPPATVAELAAWVDAHPAGLAVEQQIDSAPTFASTAVRAEKKAYYEQVVFYGTNRARTGSNDPSAFYGGDRAPFPYLSYGRCIVTIPATHKRGAVESPFLGLKFLEDENKHIRLAQVIPMERGEFFQMLKTQVHQGTLNEGWENDVVIFIHGFNVSFDESARRTAQMAYDFGFKGAPIMFSWPSDGKLYAYMSDREDIQWSIAHIEEFLRQVMDRTLPKRVHLVAHSMGNQGLIGALNLLALRRGNDQRPLFENVILAAPDFDAQMFQEQIAPQVRYLANRWTVYTSDRDAALNVSTKLNSAKRLGLPVTPVGGIDVIDATGVEVTPWSVPEFHSYYATKQKVIQDIVQTIRGVAPGMRDLRPKKAGGLAFWQFVAD